MLLLYLGELSFAIFWYLLLCGTYIMWPKQSKLWKVLSMVGSIVVVGVLTYWVLFSTVCELKAAQMNIQYCLIWEFIFYEFKLGHNAGETTKNVKAEDTVDHSMVTRWFKKFHSGCKNLDNQTSSDRPKIVVFVAVLQIINANPAKSRKYQASSASYSPGRFITFTTLVKAIFWIVPHINKSFDSW